MQHIETITMCSNLFPAIATAQLNEGEMDIIRTLILIVAVIIIALVCKFLWENYADKEDENNEIC